VTGAGRQVGRWLRPEGGRDPPVGWSERRGRLLCAVGYALVEAGRRVYTRTTDLVQKLQAARRDLALEAALAKLDRFDLIILDDIGYAQKDHAETSVLFELIDSYRRRAAAARNPTTTTGDSPDRTASDNFADTIKEDQTA
jgi:IstB-like ATP binding protein